MSLRSILEVLVMYEVNRVCHMANWIMSFVCNYGANRACHVANVIMNFVGKLMMGLIVRVMWLITCSVVMYWSCQKTNNLYVMNGDKVT